MIRPGKITLGCLPSLREEAVKGLTDGTGNKVMRSDTTPYRYYTLLGANWGFWNASLEEEPIKYKAITKYKLARVHSAPIRHQYSSDEFQRAMMRCWVTLLTKVSLYT